MPVLRTIAAACALLAGTGCSVVSPQPLWELVKGMGVVAAASMSEDNGRAIRTVRHALPALDTLCIEYNPQAEVADIVPVLQKELRLHGIDSRVYAPAQQVAACRVWLRYTAWVDWAVPPLASDPRAYIQRAALTLQANHGPVLSSSQYEVEPGLRSSKWATTHAKLAPVVTALLTGIDTPEPVSCPPPPTEVPPGVPHEALCAR